MGARLSSPLAYTLHLPKTRIQQVFGWVIENSVMTPLLQHGNYLDDLHPGCLFIDASAGTLCYVNFLDSPLRDLLPTTYRFAVSIRIRPVKYYIPFTRIQNLLSGNQTIRYENQIQVTWYLIDTTFVDDEAPLYVALPELVLPSEAEISVPSYELTAGARLAALQVMLGFTEPDDVGETPAEAEQLAKLRALLQLTGPPQILHVS